jgi:IstB-like ATP binding protein
MRPQIAQTGGGGFYKSLPASRCPDPRVHESHQGTVGLGGPGGDTAGMGQQQGGYHCSARKPVFPPPSPAPSERRLDASVRESRTLTAADAIEQLLGAQIQLRNNRRLQAAMLSSRLPAVKRLTEFDFSFQPSLRREQMESLHEVGFVERRENVVFLGPPGVGKTHLAISLAIAAAQSGRRVYYGTLADLITSLEEPQAAGRLHARLKVLTHPALLVVDEIGYLPISRTGAMLFFSADDAPLRARLDRTHVQQWL